ncbi:family 20 glycosylhydrolase [Streptomyces sp. NPDC020917]|uniref:family 20 glycosylhydrolase n=1 Tax=Streptomyces sp. NPDC020917 TaxID=3365102 RepID=UPI0037933321
MRARRVRHLVSVLAAAACLVIGIAAPADATAAPQEGPDAAPAVVPPLQHWSAGDGSFVLAKNSRIVVDSRQSPALLADARTFADDLESAGAAPLRIVTGGAPGPGDVFLTADGDGTGEGFRLEATTQSIIIAGTGPAGTFYGEQALEQILKAAPDHASVPAGSTEDAPAQRERGLMIDTARSYWSVASIKQLIRQLGWMRLNTLHWHITDSEFFRLDLPGYPGLAADKSYSPADVRAVQDFAARYHVTVVPEFDIPGHATALTAYRPGLRWDCASMNSIISPGRIDPGFTVDITKPANVAWLDGLVEQVTALFDSPVIHLGGDETPNADLQQQCPQLVDYAAAHGYSKTEDVFLAYENHLDDLLARHGKRMQIWGWWPQAGGSGSVTVNKDIRVQAWLGDEATFLAQGYDVVVSNEHSRLYVVPKYAPGTANGNYIPDDNALYSTYQVPASDHVLGLEMAEWGDNAFTMPEAYPLSYLRRPLQVLASTAWGSPRMDSYLDYEVLADDVGNAPGVPDVVDPAARPVEGVPYGSADAASAFDGDASTAPTATVAGAAVGLDLGAGGARRLAGVRLLPRSNSSADLASVVGGTVQGCTDGPDTGCRTLATVQWTPTHDWLTLPVDDSGSYRWVRFVGAPSAKPAVAEVQFLSTSADVTLTVQAPATLATGRSNTVRVLVTNPTPHALAQLHIGLTAHHLLDNTAPGEAPAPQSTTVPPHQSRTVEFTLRPRHDTSPGNYRLMATADFRSAGTTQATSRRISATSRTAVALHDLAEAFDNIAVTNDSNPQPGDIDGAKSSFSAEGLAAAGVTSDGTLNAGGLTFTLPAPLAGTEDNALAHGQVIPLSGHATRVGLLATATYAPAAGLNGTVTVTYDDGTTTVAPVTVPDWASGTIPQGTLVAADGGEVNGSGRAQSTRSAKLYVVGVDVDPGKRLASITLPAGPRYMGAKTPAVHVFAIATDQHDS